MVVQLNGKEPEVLKQNTGLIFIHIPKTAGTSIQQTIMSWVGREQSATHIESYSEADRNSLGNRRFISGHIYYDEVRKLPFSKTFKLAVIFRDPYARLSSALQMIDRFSQPENTTQLAAHPNDLVREAAAKIVDVDFKNPEQLALFLEDMLGLGLTTLNNIQTRFMDCERKLKNTDLSPDGLHVAIQNLAAIDFIGTIDKLDQFVGQIASEFGQQPPLSVMHANSSASSEWAQGRSIDHNDPDIREAMAPQIDQDLELYAHVLEVISARKKHELQ